MSRAEVLQLASEAREEIFTLLEKDDFDRIPAVAKAYRTRVEAIIGSGENRLDSTLVFILKSPLMAALEYLRIVRAHQSLTYRKQIIDRLYKRAADADPQSSVRVLG